MREKIERMLDLFTTIDILVPITIHPKSFGLRSGQEYIATYDLLYKAYRLYRSSNQEALTDEMKESLQISYSTILEIYKTFIQYNRVVEVYTSKQLPNGREDLPSLFYKEIEGVCLIKDLVASNLNQLLVQINEIMLFSLGFTSKVQTIEKNGIQIHAYTHHATYSLSDKDSEYYIIVVSPKQETHGELYLTHIVWIDEANKVSEKFYYSDRDMREVSATKHLTEIDNRILDVAEYCHTFLTRENQDLPSQNTNVLMGNSFFIQSSKTVN